MDRPGRVAAGVTTALVVTASVLLLGSDRDDSDSRDSARAGTTATPSPSGTPTADPTPVGPPLLLPNMRSLDAYDLQIDGTARGRLLRFAAALANVGDGPLLLQPRQRAPGCPPGRHPAVQRLHVDGDDDGRYRRGRDKLDGESREVGCMVRHPDHDHWHFNAMARYALRLAGEAETLVARNKVSFCLRDNRRVPAARALVRREHFGDCTRGTRQGISPGWADVYSADLAGQSLRLPRGVDGRRLCLDLEADPRGVLLETDEADNATSIGLRINGQRVRRADSQSCQVVTAP